MLDWRRHFLGKLPLYEDRDCHSESSQQKPKSNLRNLNRLGEDLRKSVDKAFAEHGIRTMSSGVGSLFTTHFLSEAQDEVSSPSDVSATRKDAQKDYYFSLIARDGIYFIPGHLGAVSTAHSRADIDAYISATEKYAKKF